MRFFPVADRCADAHAYILAAWITPREHATVAILHPMSRVSTCAARRIKARAGDNTLAAGARGHHGGWISGWCGGGESVTAIDTALKKDSSAKLRVRC